MRVPNKILLLSVWILGISFFNYGCKEDDMPTVENNLRFGISTTINGEPLALDQTYQNVLGEYVKFSLFKYYVSDVSLINNAGEVVALSEIMLCDAENPTTAEYFLPEGSYQSLRLGLGVKPELNNADPATFDYYKHPLGLGQATYWGWASRYKFVMLEGRYDTTEENLSYAFSYHTGFDTLYTVIDVPINLQLKNTETIDFSLELDANKLFFAAGDTLHVMQDSFTHAEGEEGMALAYKVTQHLAKGFEQK
ncbi:MAG: MbnP family protein [Chitinophagales bacterium]|nr:hypothetical protein [Bacteroidota bacterium]